jgi:DNA invertase Pin-like site-specific DNA recombinase
MMNPKLTPDRLHRRAIVYIRQSTPGQLIHNQESKRRQYGLVNQARELGFPEVIVIDDDLGRTGSGLVERPGFQRLVAEVCTGEVGAVFCIEASRLARNGRDWHHLIELCGMVDAVVVDPDGVYDPGIINDRLLLGLKGTMSEFELNLLRQRWPSVPSSPNCSVIGSSSSIRGNILRGSSKAVEITGDSRHYSI